MADGKAKEPVKVEVLAACSGEGFSYEAGAHSMPADRAKMLVERGYARPIDEAKD